MTKIRHDAIGLSIFVLFYSSFCLAGSVLLVSMLWRYREQASYVALIAVFVTISTTASIIQQIHYAVDWSNIKKTEYEQAQNLQPGRAYSVLGPPPQVVLLFIQLYCYNVLSLLVLFWTTSLFSTSWSISLDRVAGAEERFSLASKILAVAVPLIVITIVNLTVVSQSAILWLILNYMIMVISLTAGCILLVITLIKYVKTRRLTTRHMRRSAWWHRGTDFSQQSNLLATGPMIATEASIERTSIYDRALITRFTIAFVLLALFQVSTLSFLITQKNSNGTLATLPDPDYSLRRTQVDLVAFMPGVSASLVAFLVFGTTKSFSQYKRMLLCKPRKKRHEVRSGKSLAHTESQRRALPSPMIPSPEPISPMTMSSEDLHFPSPRNWLQNGTELSGGLSYPPRSATNHSPMTMSCEDLDFPTSRNGLEDSAGLSSGLYPPPPATFSTPSRPSLYPLQFLSEDHQEAHSPRLYRSSSKITSTIYSANTSDIHVAETFETFQVKR